MHVLLTAALLVAGSCCSDKGVDTGFWIDGVYHQQQQPLVLHRVRRWPAHAAQQATWTMRWPVLALVRLYIILNHWSTIPLHHEQTLLHKHENCRPYIHV